MSIIMRGINFGSVFVASGALNFFGEGWPYHKVCRFIPGFNFQGATFVSKTTTLDPRTGNMPLKANLMPRKLLPPCIWVNFKKGMVLNSVGLSGPGAKALLQERKRKWQERERSFLISFMAIGETLEKRLKETESFTQLIKIHKPDFKTTFGIELNISCPNTQHDPKLLEKEALTQLEILSKLEVPLVLKVNALISTEVLVKIDHAKACDTITISNTIPWGQLSSMIRWTELFNLQLDPRGREVILEESPLWQRNHDFGGGGLSGWPLVDVIHLKIHAMRKAGVNLPIIAGGGIGCRRVWHHDITLLQEAGANAISIGSVAILRPWRIQSIIQKSQKIFI